MATHSSILAWKIPWTEEPGGLQFIGLQTFSIGVNFLDKSYRPQSTGKNSSVHGILQARILEWAAIFFSRDLPTPGLNPGLPHCRQTLYCLSHQGSLKGGFCLIAMCGNAPLNCKCSGACSLVAAWGLLCNCGKDAPL